MPVLYYICVCLDSFVFFFGSYFLSESTKLNHWMIGCHDDDDDDYGYCRLDFFSLQTKKNKQTNKMSEKNVPNTTNNRLKNRHTQDESIIISIIYHSFFLIIISLSLLLCFAFRQRIIIIIIIIGQQLSLANLQKTHTHKQTINEWMKITITRFFCCCCCCCLGCHSLKFIKFKFNFIYPI